VSQSQQPRQQFTGKERDSETGLDYFLARYYSPIQGRFTSPDEFTGGPDELYDFAWLASDNPTFYADLTDPQSLNKYQYTYNNPLFYTDPDGHCPACAELLRPVVVPAGREIAKTAAPVIAGLAAWAASKVDWKKVKEAITEIGAKSGGDCLGTPYPNSIPKAVDHVIFSKSSNQGSGNQGAPNQSGSNVQQGSGDEKPPFGHRGTQTTSTTVWKARGSKERVDVENPNPGQRPGQIHYQDKNNKKYLYEADKKAFKGASDSLNKELLSRPEIQKAIQKALKILGEEAQ
jgi:RHS repeat-associated protein